MKKVLLHLLLLIFIVAGCAPAVTPSSVTEHIRPELSTYFQGFDGAFVMYDLQESRYTRYQPQRCAERLLPASTFKILNALIALETGVIPDENYVIPWDGTPYEIKSWNQDHTLKTAFQNSVVWYYQEVAARIGSEKMQQFVDAVGYGNRDITSNGNPFWLDGPLRISADEQVEFLKRLYLGDLPFSERSMKIVRNMMILETDAHDQLRGRTGTGLMDDQHIGWFVGYHETNGNVLFFALNITGSNPQADGKKAREILLEILDDISSEE